MKRYQSRIREIVARAVVGCSVVATLAISPTVGQDFADRDGADRIRQREYFNVDSQASSLDQPVITLRPPNELNQSIEKDRKAIAAEIRMQRAQYQARQRMLRREHMLWTGQTPLRPDFSPNPMMTSRYSQPTIYVPIFVR